MAESYYVMTPDDIVLGWLPGVVGTLPTAAPDLGTPRQELERVIRTSLERPPCGVAFSGGVDSSLVLAVATHVARRDGLPDPVPVTRVFPDLPETDERDHQELVVRHLGLTEWRRVHLTDEVDIVGPLARRHLTEHGVVWPPALAATTPLFDGLDGGSLLDGEGGDEVLSVESHRIAPIAGLVVHPRPIRRWRVKAAIGAIAPRPLRRRRAHRHHDAIDVPWLRADARERLAAATTQAQVELPLSFAASVRQVPRTRGQVRGAQNRRLHAREHGVDLASPLLHPDVVHAIARDGGFLGPGNRAMLLGRVVPDLLPAAVWSRPDKVFFNRAYIGPHARAFARSWSGDGIDAAAVDAERLRAVWLSDRPPSTSAALLQQAWLATDAA